jgi:hypothetical protein
MQAARDLARLKNQGIGKSISEIARRGMIPDSEPFIEMEDGIPVWKHRPGAITVTSEMVRNLIEEA